MNKTNEQKTFDLLIGLLRRAPLSDLEALGANLAVDTINLALARLAALDAGKAAKPANE